MRPGNNNRTAGIIDPLSKEILAETPLFALEHITEGLERPFIGAGNNPAAPAVIKKHINRFLQHAFFVTHDDIRGIKLKKPF